MKALIQSPDTQEQMNVGIQKVADIVRCTLGPYGRNVAIMDTRAEHSQPLLTDDGVRVVEFALGTLSNLELLGAKLVYTSSKKTEEDVGDGTTSTYLVAASVIDEYLKYKRQAANKSELNPVLVRKGMNLAKKWILEYLDKAKIATVTQDILTNIAVSASGSEEIGKVVGELRHRLGPDGLVNIRASRNNSDVINYSSGYEFTGGFVNQELFTNKPLECYDPIVAIIDKMIATNEDAAAIINAYMKFIKVNQMTVETPLVVLCNKFEGDALNVIYRNWFMRQDKLMIPIVPVEVPITSDHVGTLGDLSVLTGAKVISARSGKLDENELFNAFGRASNIKAGKKMTYIVGGNSENTKGAIEARIEDLKAQMAKLTDQAQNAEYANIAVRISKLNGIAVTIEVGAATDIERVERKLKYDDAVLATHAASKDGVVIGAGYTLYKASTWIMETYGPVIAELHADSQSEAIGCDLMLKVLRLPFELIPNNSGVLDFDKILERIEKMSHDELDSKILYINLDTMALETLQPEDCKVYDPYLVAKSVIENAVSAVSLFVSTENSILFEMK